jgi:hypothetical protein
VATWLNIGSYMKLVVAALAVPASRVTDVRLPFVSYRV